MTGPILNPLGEPVYSTDCGKVIEAGMSNQGGGESDSDLECRRLCIWVTLDRQSALVTASRSAKLSATLTAAAESKARIYTSRTARHPRPRSRIRRLGSSRKALWFGRAKMRLTLLSVFVSYLVAVIGLQADGDEAHLQSRDFVKESVSTSWPRDGAASPKAAITRLEHDSPSVKDLLRILARWRKAVVATDTETLLEFAWPEEREGLRRAMSNASSLGSRIMFGRRRSVRRMFAGSLLTLTLFRHELGLPDDYLIACYCRGSVRWPKTYVRLQRLSNRTTVLCLDWTHVDKQWYVSYGFAYGE